MSPYHSRVPVTRGGVNLSFASKSEAANSSCKELAIQALRGEYIYDTKGVHFLQPQCEINIHYPCYILLYFLNPTPAA